MWIADQLWQQKWMLRFQVWNVCPTHVIIQEKKADVLLAGLTCALHSKSINPTNFQVPNHIQRHFKAQCSALKGSPQTPLQQQRAARNAQNSTLGVRGRSFADESIKQQVENSSKQFTTKELVTKHMSVWTSGWSFTVIEILIAQWFDGSLSRNRSTVTCDIDQNSLMEMTGMTSEGITATFVFLTCHSMYHTNTRISSSRWQRANDKQANKCANTHPSLPFTAVLSFAILPFCIHTTPHAHVRTHTRTHTATQVG